MHRMFRRYFEANDDTGTPAATEVDDGSAGSVLPGPDTRSDAAEGILDAIRAANADPAADAGVPATVTPEGTAPEATPATPEAKDDLILGRFKTNEDLIQAYQNLEPEYTQTRQQLKDMERQLAELTAQSQQPREEFLFDSPFSQNPTNVEELEALASEHPDKAAIWAITNSDKLDPNLVQETINYWHTRNPAQATAYMLQTMMQQFVPAIQQQIAPATQAHTEGVVQRGVSMAEEMIGPSYPEFHERIIDAFEANPTLMPTDPQNPELMRDAIVNTYAMLLGKDMLEKGRAAATGGAAAPSPAAALAQTVTRTQAPAATNDDPNEAAISKMIQDSILNAR